MLAPWCIQIVLSSDKLSSLRRPVVIVKLSLAADDDTEKEVLLEFTEEELDALLDKLGGAQKVSGNLCFGEENLTRLT
jgi:hypothetical protein